MTFERMSAAQYLETIAHAAPTGASARRSTKKRASPEEDLQRASAEWVFLHEKRYPVLRWMYHTPNGGARSAGEAGKLKAMGVRKGVVDWICPFASRAAPGLAIELKAPGKKATPEQLEYLTMAQANGWVNGVADNMDDFLRLVGLFLRSES